MALIDTPIHDHPQTSSGAMEFPETATHLRVTPFDTADLALAELRAQKTGWAGLVLKEKIELLDEALKDFSGLGEDWVRESLKAKGALPGGYAEGEEWFMFSAVLRLVRLLRQSLADILREGHPKPPGKVKVLENGQLSVPVFPATLMEKALFSGYHAETWLEPSVGMDEPFRQPADGAGKVVVVLGAGNASVSPCADMLHWLFVENAVVALKLNPVNDFLGPFIEMGFQGLIRSGYLRILYGGAELGRHLVEHPAIDRVHITGSDKTFNHIVFGTGSEGEQRKDQSAPKLTKPVTAELGCVNPLIIVPGEWKEKDYHRAADMITTWMSSNAGFNCLNPRLIVTQKNWQGRRFFLDTLRKALSNTLVRPAYYPGSEENRTKFLDFHPDAQLFTYEDSHAEVDGSIDSLPIAFISDLDPAEYQDVCFTSEPFGMLISETAIEADSTSDFLARATEFVNQRVWGTLSLTMIAPPQVERNPKNRQALQQAFRNLRYGTICVNLFAGLAYTLVVTPWGGYPNQPINDLQSGTGFINNPLMLNHPEKTVFTAPFYRIDPVSIHNRHLMQFCRAYTQFQLNPGLGNLLKTFWLALQR